MNSSDYDVIIAGGSLSGLLSARELANHGNDVLVLEEHSVIGLPEKCDGLVSLNALSSLGIIPNWKIIQNKIIGARLFAPSGECIQVDSSQLDIVVLNRAKFDKQLSEQAISSGVKIDLSNKYIDLKSNENLIIRSQNYTQSCKYFIDAMGITSLIQKRKFGIIQAAKYIIEADWFENNKVDLYFNQKLSPGFFTWVIPINDNIAKVGIAGYGINPFAHLDSFLKTRKSKIISKIACPIVVGGPLDSFIEDSIVRVGDSAGQTKPSTAGGIFSGGVGGILAGQNISYNLESNNNSLYQYEKTWKNIFQKEFNMTLRARQIFEKFENKHLDKIFTILSSSSDFLDMINNSGDFDFHSYAILQSLGLKNIAQIIKLVSGNEFFSLFQKTNYDNISIFEQNDK